jgi:DNA-binding HxlR family transcriptional regulator
MSLEFLTRTGTREILQQLQDNPKRFSEFKNINRRTLAKRLIELEDIKLISRIVLNERPVKVVYELTPKGREILANLKELEKKISKNSRLSSGREQLQQT